MGGKAGGGLFSLISHQFNGDIQILRTEIMDFP